MSRECPVRYIITVNALKEGWDCPFAYILASVANRSSKIDVEQILGRVLRQPYTRQHGSALLNMSYVLTSSTNFHTTIDNVVESLRMSGYSRRDYIANDTTTNKTDVPNEPMLNFRNDEALKLGCVNDPKNDETAQEELSEWNFKAEDINIPSTSQQKAIPEDSATISLMKQAEEMSRTYERQVKESTNSGISEEIMQKTNIFPIRKTTKI